MIKLTHTICKKQLKAMSSLYYSMNREMSTTITSHSLLVFFLSF